MICFGSTLDVLSGTLSMSVNKQTNNCLISLNSLPLSVSAVARLFLVYFLMTGFSPCRLWFLFWVKLPVHALLAKHTDKRHGVNGSLCHMDHEIGHNGATEAPQILMQVSFKCGLDSYT